VTEQNLATAESDAGACQAVTECVLRCLKTQKKRLFDRDRRAGTFRADGRLATRSRICAAWLAIGLTTDLLGLFVPQGFGVDRLSRVPPQEVVGKAEDLKTVAITDEPEIQLVPLPVGGRNLDKARQTGLPFDGFIGARFPAA
jgi:hypothetical protein